VSTSTQGRDVTAPGAVFTPSRRVPDAGLSWWSEPDPERDADGTLDARLPVQVLEETTGWAHVRCENEFECWVDAALLVETAPAEAPTEVEEAPTAVDEAPTDVDEATEVQDAPTEVQEAPVEAEVRAAPLATPMGKDARISIGLSIAGAVIAMVGGFLPWYSTGGADVTAWDIRLVALFTKEPTDLSLEVGPVLLITALSALALLLRRPLPAWAALALAGVPLVLGIAGFAFYSDLPGSAADLGLGVIVTIVGGVVMLAGLLVSPRMLPRPLIRLGRGDA
jgi:hypothetical protein